MLRELGFSVQVFTSGEEFLESGVLHSTKCLILDIAMPAMSGPELQMELLRLKLQIPIVFITAGVDESISTHVIAQGAVQCLLKPFSDTALLDALNAALQPSVG